MNNIVLKSYQKNEKIALVTVFTLCIALWQGMLIAELLKPKEVFTDWFLFILFEIFFLISFSILAVSFIPEFRKELCITEDAVICISGKKVVKTIPKDQIIAYGVFSQYEKHLPGFPFFCYATVNEVSAIAKKYWLWRKRIYHKKQLEELERTPEGMWILQMSIYIYWEQFRLEKNRKYIAVNHITKEELHAIWELWQQKPMLLGSMALYFPWRHL